VRLSANTTRAAVLGAGDGLLTNLSLTLGVAGAAPPAGVVRLAGVAGLLAGAFSMAAGELVSVRAMEELEHRTIAAKRAAIAADPAGEEAGLAGLCTARGMTGAEAAQTASLIHRYPGLALDVHAQLELGMNPSEPGSSWQAAAASAVSFAAGAFLPLAPWLLAAGRGAVIASVVAGAVAALALGGVTGAMGHRSIARTAMRQLAVAAVAAAVTYAAGHLLGLTLPHG
jgi:VIT1/CCC1 family predicted Fe2+/Mn2+ transporter